jgi:isopenicillin-N N-acyltransferase-like protein
MLELPLVTCTGTPEELGHAYGTAVKAQVQAFVDQRLRAAKVYLYERGFRDLEPFRQIGAACLTALKTWHPEGWVEHCATAAAAGVDPVDLYTTGNMTDVRDVLALGRPVADAEGCTTALAPAAHTRDGRLIAAQTWDLNPTDLDFVVAVHRRPTNGLATWSITCAGCPSLMGMNAAGVAVGTTNIKTRGSRPGIPYLSLLHGALQCVDRGAAERLISSAPRAAAHTYWIAGPDGACDLECTADTVVRRDLADGPLTRTNHCLVPEHQRREGEAATMSSQARLGRARAALARRDLDVAALQALFSDRSDGVDSINRFAEDGQGTSTNACLIAIPAAGELHACRGSADRGRWVRLAFA